MFENISSTDTCPYCEKPITTPEWVEFGGYFLHPTCHTKMNDDWDDDPTLLAEDAFGSLIEFEVFCIRAS